MMNYCFSCGKWLRLNRACMCAGCMTLWLSATPVERRRLIHVVPSS